RFWLDSLVLSNSPNALRRRYSNWKSWRYHPAGAGNFERCRSGRGRGHPALRDFVEALPDRQTDAELSRAQRSNAHRAADRATRGRRKNRAHYRCRNARAFRSRRTIDSRMHQTRTAFHNHPGTFFNCDRACGLRIFEREIFLRWISPGQKWAARTRVARRLRAQRNIYLLRIALSTRQDA